MNDRLRSGLIGAGIGGAAMFLLDPGGGAGRRARIKEESVHLAHKTRDVARGMSPAKRIACGVAAGGAAIAIARLRHRGEEDDVDAARVEIVAVEVAPAEDAPF